MVKKRLSTPVLRHGHSDLHDVLTTILDKGYHEKVQHPVTM